jgi:hypothetical protein
VRRVSHGGRFTHAFAKDGWYRATSAWAPSLRSMSVDIVIYRNARRAPQYTSPSANMHLTQTTVERASTRKILTT